MNRSLLRFMGAVCLLLLCVLLLSQSTAVTATFDPLAPPAAPASQAEELQIALDYIAEQREALNLSETDVADLVVTDRYTTARTGVTHIYLRQRVNGLEVIDSSIGVHILPSGEVLTMSDRFVSGLENVLQGNQPQLTSVAAVQRTAEHLDIDVRSGIEIVSEARGVAQETEISAADVSRLNIPLRLVYQQTEDRGLRLAWDLVVDQVGSSDLWNFRVDAITGKLIGEVNWTIHENWEEQAVEAHGALPQMAAEPAAPPEVQTPQEITSASDPAYLVYAMPLQDPDDGPRSVVSGAEDPVASPYGWHDVDGLFGPEFTITQGNNVHAYTDQNTLNQSSGDEPDGGPNLLFGQPIDLTQSPLTYSDGSVTNLFYWNNVIHDVFYQYGFDEVSGNFQQNNYGRGGVGGDPVQAEAQDGGGLNNANFATPPENFPAPPRMQMFLGGPNANGVLTDGSLDNHVVVHEYVHGISTRLVGGPNTNCLNSVEQGGEGWSDYLGLVLIMQAGDEREDAFPIGNYLFGNPPSGPGIRPFPYSTDFGVNPTTFDDVSDFFTFSQPHGIGSIWANMLWEVYWDLVDRDGFDPDFYNGSGGNNAAILLVVDGLKYTACSPSFIDQRDGVLAADLANFPISPTPAAGFPQSENECLLWDAFARRGLGYSADSGSANNRFDQVAAFDLPPQCQVDPSFELAVTPATSAICSIPDEDAIFDVDVQSFLAYSEVVTLSATGVPTGTTTTFTPNGQAAAYSSELAVGNMGAAPAGDYDIEIVGTASSSGPYTTTVGLSVATVLPGVPTLTLPTDGALDLSPITAVDLDWSGAAAATGYFVEVAEDSGFATLVYTDTVDGSAATIPTGALDANETYYWRVTAQNVCGDGTTSVAFSFSTAGYGDVLLVDGDGNIPNSSSAFSDALDDLGLAYDVWDAGPALLDVPSTALLSEYAAVIWNGGNLAPVPAAGETALAGYLDAGGCAFVAAQDYHFNTGVTPFMNSYLGVEAVVDDVAHSSVTGVNDFAVLNTYNLAYPFGNWSDDITPTSSASIAFTGDAGNNAAAVYKDTGTYKSTFWGFAFEALPGSTSRARALVEVLSWCDAALSGDVVGIALNKTAGTDAEVCGTASELIVPSGADVTYCYEVTNIGNVDLDTHDLVDDQLGTVLSGFAYNLQAGASVFITQTINITADVTNTGVWTATSGADTASASATATVNVLSTAQAYDSCIDFETGVLPNTMTAITTASGPAVGQVEVTSRNPKNGTYALDLDTSVDGFFTQQAAILMVDLSGQTEAELAFWVFEAGDENHPQDGIFISDDNGATYTQVLSLNNFPASYQYVQIDLDEAAADAGLTFNDRFLIKFQSFDNFSYGLDGYSFDDICVGPATPNLVDSRKVAPSRVASGDVFEYAIVIENTSTTAASGATLVDVIPTGVALAGAPSATSGAAVENGGQIEWNGDVAGGSAVTITFPVSVTAGVGATITNTAVIDQADIAQPVTLTTFTDVVDANPFLQVEGVDIFKNLSLNGSASGAVELTNIGFADLDWEVKGENCTDAAAVSWLTLSSSGGQLARDEGETLVLDFDADGLDTGIYTDFLCIVSDDPDDPEQVVQVYMVVDFGSLYMPFISKAN